MRIGRFVRMEVVPSSTTRLQLGIDSNRHQDSLFARACRRQLRIAQGCLARSLPAALLKNLDVRQGSTDEGANRSVPREDRANVFVRETSISKPNRQLSKSAAFADHASSSSRPRALCCDSGKPVARRFSYGPRKLFGGRHHIETIRPGPGGRQIADNDRLTRRQVFLQFEGLHGPGHRQVRIRHDQHISRLSNRGEFLKGDGRMADQAGNRLQAAGRGGLGPDKEHRSAVQVLRQTFEVGDIHPLIDHPPEHDQGRSRRKAREARPGFLLPLASERDPRHGSAGEQGSDSSRASPAVRRSRR